MYSEGQYLHVRNPNKTFAVGLGPAEAILPLDENLDNVILVGPDTIPDWWEVESAEMWKVTIHGIVLEGDHLAYDIILEERIV